MSEKLERVVKAAKNAYQAIEDSVVGTYQKIEEGAVGAYGKVEDFFVDKMFRKDGETVEEAKERLKDHI